MQEDESRLGVELMETYVGTALVPVKPWSRASIIVDLVEGFLVVWTKEGRWLGSWPATDASVEAVYDDRVMLVLGDEKVPFETKDPDGFARAVARETRRILEMNLVERLVRAARARALSLVNRSSTLAVWLEKGSESTVHEPDRSSGGMTSQSEASSATRVEGMNTDLVADLLEPAQKEVFSALDSGMRAWFGFYFRTAAGTGEERILSAVKGLREAASTLIHVFDDLGNAGDLDASSKEYVEDYREVVQGWAESMKLIALGLELDQKHTADHGFGAMLSTNDLARKLVAQRSAAEGILLSREPLIHLDRLQPPARIGKKAVKQAKQPWREMIICAGSPFRIV